MHSDDAHSSSENSAEMAHGAYVRRDFPFGVNCIDPLWIMLSDGTRIAGTLWLPVTVDKVPVVVEMIPYRRRDGTVFRDLDIQPYLAGCGVATCRVDIRGTGD